MAHGGARITGSDARSHLVRSVRPRVRTMLASNGSMTSVVVDGSDQGFLALDRTRPGSSGRRVFGIPAAIARQAETGIAAT